MRHVVESVTAIAIILIAIVLKDAAGVDIKYVALSGIGIVVVYGLHLAIQYKMGLLLSKQLTWLFSLRRYGVGLYAIEKHAYPNSNIYLVTPDLYNDARNAETQAVVLSNLKKGITYYYLIDDDSNKDESIKTNEEMQKQSHVNEVLHRFREYRGQVNIYKINKLFGLVPSSNILVIATDQTGKLRVFIELPVIENGRHDWWVEADMAKAEHWHRTVLLLLKDRRALPNPFAE